MENVALVNLIKLREKTNNECQAINEKITHLLENSISNGLTEGSEFISLSKELFALHDAKTKELTQIDNVISSVLEMSYNKQEDEVISNFARK